MKKGIGLFMACMLAFSVMVTGGCQSKGAQESAGAKDKAPASKYPEKPIEFVVHTKPGAGADILARTVSDILSKEKMVAQPITVANKSGGSGAVAFSYVAEKKSDPYVLLAAQPTLVTTSLKSGGSNFSIKSFAPLAGLAADESVVVVKADSKYKNMEDLISAAKKAPKAVSQGGGAIGASDSIVGHLIQKATGVTFNYVSFGTGGEVPPALLGGNVDFIVANPAEVQGLVEGKKLRIIGVAADKRMEGAPDVPTLKEQGINVVYQSFRGIVAPAGIPADAAAYWEGVLEKMTKTEAWKKYLKDNSLTPSFMKSADFGKYLEEQTKIYEVVMKEMGQLK